MSKPLQSIISAVFVLSLVAGTSVLANPRTAPHRLSHQTTRIPTVRLVLVKVQPRTSPKPSVAAPRSLVPPWVMAATERVHVCEEPSWNVRGSKYAGGLGWLWATWWRFRYPKFPSCMCNATPEQQAWAMWRFAKTYYWPDQRFCGGGY